MAMPEQDRATELDERQNLGSLPDAYSGEEIRQNRRSILLWTAGFLVFFWTMTPVPAAIALTVLSLLVALLFMKLFASHSATKLGDDFAGSGKRVHPRTMGVILGYLYRGFRND